DKEKDKEKEPTDKVDPKPATPGPWGPPAPVAARMYEPTPPLDLIALRKEFLGPFATFPEPPQKAKVVSVSRWSADKSVARTLADAWNMVVGEEAAIIEIHDQGPLFVPPLPLSRCRQPWLRAGPGFRPLLAWSVEGPGADKMSAWATL